MSTCCCNHSDDSCPEVVAVTVDATTVDNQPLVAITVSDTDPVDVTKQEVSIQVSPAGTYNIQLRFEDTLTPVGTPSITAPDTMPGVAELEVVTDATGLYEVTVEHNGVQRTWYLSAILAGIVTVSDPIVCGV